MSRPHNYTITHGGSVISTSPKNLKAALTSVAAGISPAVVGKNLGVVAVDFSTLTPDMAAAKLAALFPVKVEATPTVTADVVEPTTAVAS